MKSLAFLKILFPMLVIIAILTLMGLLLPPLGGRGGGRVQAQGGPLPTPTNEGGGGNNGNDNNNGGGSGGDGGNDNSSGNGEAQAAPAGVSGFVYNYSSAANDGGGLTVVLSGGGWQAETVADSNGFYYFGGLGQGPATLHLRLPPDPSPVPLEWPIRLQPGIGEQVNLGFYWGNDPPIPVRLSGQLVGTQLVVQVENRTRDEASGGLLKIITTPGTRIAPVIQASRGELLFAAHHTQIKLDRLAAGDKALTQLTLKRPEATIQAGQTPTIRLIFTYDQQITPQMLEFQLEVPLQAAASSLEAAALSEPAAAAASAAADAGAAFSPNEGAAAPLQPQTQAAPRQEPSANPDTSAAPTTTEGQAPAAAPLTAPATPPAEQTSPLPTTGRTIAAPPTAKFAVAVLLILGLALAGWQAVAKGR